MRSTKKILLILNIFFLCNIWQNIYPYKSLPLKGLFNVLKIDDIGFGKALLESHWIENVYEYGEGNPARSQEGRGLSNPTGNDPVVNLIRTLWFRLGERDNLLPTKVGAPLGLTGNIFAQLMNHIYKGSIYDTEAILGTKKRAPSFPLRNEWFETAQKEKRKINSRARLRNSDVNNLITLIKNALELCQKGQKYLQRTTEAILWAFFFEKLEGTWDEKKDAVNQCLDLIDETFKNRDVVLTDFYSKQDFFRFKDELNTNKYEKPDYLLDYLLSDYDKSLSALTELPKGQYPPIITQGYYGYEFEPGKISLKRPTCYESALLDLYSIFWYNPETEVYDNSLLPPAATNGKGFKQLAEALKYFYLADQKVIKIDQYTLSFKRKKFTSLNTLKTLINEQEVDQLNISDVPIHYITDPRVGQVWMNIVSGKTNLGLTYYSEIQTNTGTTFELLPSVNNFINLFNYMYGFQASTVEELGRLLSTDTRKITLSLNEENSDTNNTIYVKIENTINYSISDINVVIHPLHGQLDVPDREVSLFPYDTKNQMSEQILNRLIPKKTQEAEEEGEANTTTLTESKKIKELVIFTLLTSTDTLSLDFDFPLSYLNLIYYSLLLKRAPVKIEIIKDIMLNRRFFLNDLKPMIYNFLDMLPHNDLHLGHETFIAIYPNFDALDSHDERLFAAMKPFFDATPLLASFTFNHLVFNTDFSNRSLKNDAHTFCQNFKINCDNIFNPNKTLQSAISERNINLISKVLKEFRPEIDETILSCGLIRAAAKDSGILDIFLGVLGNEIYSLTSRKNIQECLDRTLEVIKFRQEVNPYSLFGEALLNTSKRPDCRRIFDALLKFEYTIDKAYLAEALIYAVENQNEEIVNALLKFGYKIDEAYLTKALIYALANQNEEIIDALLKFEHKINIDQLRTILAFAFKEKCSQAIFEKIIHFSDPLIASAFKIYDKKDIRELLQSGLIGVGRFNTNRFNTLLQHWGKWLEADDFDKIALFYYDNGEISQILKSWKERKGIIGTVLRETLEGNFVVRVRDKEFICWAPLSLKGHIGINREVRIIPPKNRLGKYKIIELIQ